MSPKTGGTAERRCQSETSAHSRSKTIGQGDGFGGRSPSPASRKKRMQKQSGCKEEALKLFKDIKEPPPVVDQAGWLVQPGTPQPGQLLQYTRSSPVAPRGLSNPPRNRKVQEELVAYLAGCGSTPATCVGRSTSKHSVGANSPRTSSNPPLVAPVSRPRMRKTTRNAWGSEGSSSTASAQASPANTRPNSRSSIGGSSRPKAMWGSSTSSSPGNTAVEDSLTGETAMAIVSRSLRKKRFELQATLSKMSNEELSDLVTFHDKASRNMSRVKADICSTPEVFGAAWTGASANGDNTPRRSCFQDCDDEKLARPWSSSATICPNNNRSQKPNLQQERLMPKHLTSLANLAIRTRDPRKLQSLADLARGKRVALGWS
eukprot:TRINITY_DN29002_c0_g1_i1.p1 TRINITY_DN29002_c0_g1~~TRINITY_DN29002_c0_g1_i1.p1  ORF type:complete len:375 (+),score=53.25 TRINITY_DN29002_c0_g1_i1:237-1361(+)